MFRVHDITASSKELSNRMINIETLHVQFTETEGIDTDSIFVTGIFSMLMSNSPLWKQDFVLLLSFTIEIT